MYVVHVVQGAHVRMPHVSSTLSPVPAQRPESTVKLHSAPPPKVIYVPPSPSDCQVRALVRAMTACTLPVMMLAANDRFAALRPTAPSYCNLVSTTGRSTTWAVHFMFSSDALRPICGKPMKQSCWAAIASAGHCQPWCNLEPLAAASLGLGTWLQLSRN